jgi:hypothetical protein
MNCANHPDVAAVAYCRTCGKPLCSNCTRSVHGVIYCETCLGERLGSVPSSSGIPPIPPVPPMTTVPGSPNPALAGILSIFPGVGAVYAGQYAKGIAHMVIVALLIAAQTVVNGAFAHVVVAISLGFFYVYQIVDAVHSARAIQLGQPAPDPFGLTRSFSTGTPRSATSSAKMPTGALILIILGFLFLLNTTFDWEIGNFWPFTLIALGGWLFAKRWGLAGQRMEGCNCERCRARGLMGPAVLVCLGVQFLLNQFDVISFPRTLPALLIVIGLVKIFQSNASSAGHVEIVPGGAPIPPPVSSEQSPSSEVNHG